MAALTYAQAGVDRAASDRLVERISTLTRSTLNRKVKSAVGGYASLYEIDKKKWLAASTDGVGTKLKLAFWLDEHQTVGIDLVAMSVNDLLCVGAEPLFFLDYFATGRLDPRVAEHVLSGIVEGCRQAKCALVGGETAEMPDFYSPGEYDLGGFAVGILNPKDALPSKEVRPGDVLIGVGSSGVHSNGFSLVRKLLFQQAIKDSPSTARGVSERDEEVSPDPRLARELLTPTRIYVKSISPLVRDGALKGLAHITGSGFLNIPRISPKFSYELELPPRSERPSVFEWIRNASGLPLEELAQTFNMGIGMVAVVSPRDANSVLKKLKRSGEKAWIVGEVVRRRRGAKESEVLVREDEQAVMIS